MDTHATPLTIEVVSDVVCPWCFVGKRNLDEALRQLAQQAPQTAVSVRWLPYFLNPDAPPGGEPYRAALERKFGGAAQVDAAWARVSEMGRQAGIAFAFERIQRRIYTLDAHRLIHRFQQRGDAGALVERLFDARFQRGEDIADHAVLAAIAGECGDDAQAVLTYLASEQDVDEVKALAADVRAAGVNGVPYFIFNRRQAVSGAQPPHVLLETMQRALA